VRVMSDERINFLKGEKNLSFQHSDFMKLFW
jgi:hypothetical protein